MFQLLYPGTAARDDICYSFTATDGTIESFSLPMNSRYVLLPMLEDKPYHLAKNCSGLTRHTKAMERQIPRWRDESVFAADYGYDRETVGSGDPFSFGEQT
jgi:hypothetical protein